MIEPKGARPRACDQARVIQVIETKAIRGMGKSEEDPVRTVIQYWDFDGLLLAEKDPCKEVSEE
jgi:hypothetical protein